MMVLPIIIVAGILLLGTAAGVHATQVAREKLARRRQRAADARAGERAEREAAVAAEDLRRSRNPQHYLSVQRGLISMLLAPLQVRLRQRRAALDQLQTELEDATPRGSRRWQLLAGAFLLLLVVLFALSISQLVPSFHVLADPQAAGPTVLDWVLGVLVATLEICVAFALAYALRPKKGWRPFAPKAYAALALLLAGMLIYGQLEWAPLHDTIPLRSQLAAAQETLVLDQQDNKPQIDLTADQQQISQIQARLPQVTARDQVMALAVTLGSDLAAFPALGAVVYIGLARRRRRLRHRVATVKAEVGELERQIVEIPERITFETQQTLERLGINPDYVLAPAAAPSPTPAPLALPPAPARPDPRPADQTPPGEGPLTPDDLFPPGPPEPEPTAAGDDRRWTDPL
jgi:hypothetical protein